MSSGLYPLPSLRCAQLRTLKGKYSAGDTHLDEADEQVVCFGMSETAEAMRNLKEIVSTPKLDGVYIGPADLPIGLTKKKYQPGFDHE